MTESGHVPVLLEEALACLDINRPGTYIDCTLGLAGHALEILERNPGASLIGLDRDRLSLNLALKRLRPHAARVKVYEADFRSLPELPVDWAGVRGILADLGISSFQLDSPERGFSFNLDGPLDMRTDLKSRLTAAKIIAEASEPRLAEILETYGELSQARKLAREIVRRRKLRPLAATSDLRQIIEEFYRWRPQKGKLHPAAKVFQALRIEVNGELKGLGDFLEAVAFKSVPGTRLAAISFHSLEDRIVKQTFVRLASGADGSQPILRILTKKPVVPTDKEVALNSRAHSAKLRAAERA